MTLTLTLSGLLATALLGSQPDREVQAAAATDPQQLVDLAAERFVVYVPKHRPPSGCALLVFLARRDEVALPTGSTTMPPPLKRSMRPSRSSTPLRTPPAASPVASIAAPSLPPSPPSPPATRKT